MTYQQMPDFLWELFQQLRRYHFALEPDDYEALWLALRAGYGWASREALRNLCCALWAKSRQDKETLEVLFNQLGVPDWQLPELEAKVSLEPLEGVGGQSGGTSRSGGGQVLDAPMKPEIKVEPLFQEPKSPQTQLITETAAELPPILLSSFRLPRYASVLVPQFPLGYREVAQTWRRLRQLEREGPLVELDVAATVARRCRLGIVSDVVLAPRRRNTARLLVLIDRQGSMAPFHRFADYVCAAILQTSRLKNVAVYYFHDVPEEGADETVLEALPRQLFPSLDTILPKIEPLPKGFLYTDPDMLSSQAIPKVLESHAHGAAVVLLSDAGAARRRYDLLRLLDSVAFLKALRAYTTRIAWLNPLPRAFWAKSTAAQIARHVPMFPMDRSGMYQAVDVLRGRPAPVERPL